jgi:glycosyltransferase involved in cell wall biosynthesis
MSPGQLTEISLPKVSIVIPAFNDAHYLPESINGILN